MTWVYILIVFALLLVEGLFVASEMALVTLRESQVRSLAERGRRGRRLQRLVQNPNRFLSAVQIGVTPQYKVRRRAVSLLSVVAKIGARGLSADSRRAVPPPRVTATIAWASPRLASVTAASHSACAWSSGSASVGTADRSVAGIDSASLMIASSV